MSRQSVLELFEEEKSFVKCCAPMVRYSKLAFRTLVRQYDCQLAFTPMIIADAFIRSERARHNEFTTNEGDRPLIVQFAASDAHEFASATELVSLYCDGVNLNCGCPQRWAISKGLGAHLLTNPELVSDMIHQARNRIPTSLDKFTISAKIRINHNIDRTVDFCRQLQHAGVSWLAVHARTVEQRCEPINVDALRTIRQSLDIPVMANGDICSLSDAENICRQTGTKGVMCARGLLQNPAMFSKDAPSVTTAECIRNWLSVALSTGLSLNLLQHHLVYMSCKLISNPHRHQLTSLSSVAAVLDFLDENYSINLIDR